MNLISCDGCGVVFDANKLNFPENIYNKDNSINDDLAWWNGSDFVPMVRCQFCNEPLIEE